jgi:hypothetical protein
MDSIKGYKEHSGFARTLLIFGTFFLSEVPMAHDVGPIRVRQHPEEIRASTARSLRTKCAVTKGASAKKPGFLQDGPTMTESKSYVYIVFLYLHNFADACTYST